MFFFDAMDPTTAARINVPERKRKRGWRPFTEWLTRHPNLRAHEYQQFEAAGNAFIRNVSLAA